MNLVLIPELLEMLFSSGGIEICLLALKGIVVCLIYSFSHG